MTRPVVYLAGPIAGTEAGEAFEWRAEAKFKLLERGIEARSPLRAKHKLDFNPISDDFNSYKHLGWAYTPHGILTRDHHDVITSDALLVNLLGARKQSFGTGMELAWAFDRHIPVVVAIEDTDNPHDRHPMFAAAVKFRVPTLDEAIDAVAVILGR